MPYYPTLGQLLSADKEQTFNFFLSGLGEVCEPWVQRDELVYNASLMTYYSLVSCDYEGDDLPCPRTLACTFDNHIYLERDPRCNHRLYEVLGCQVLLFTGFFSGQMGRRHNLKWHRQNGARFYMSASATAKDEGRAEFFTRMARNFPEWAERQARFHKELREKPYLLRTSEEGYEH